MAALVELQPSAASTGEVANMYLTNASVVGGVHALFAVQGVPNLSAACALGSAFFLQDAVSPSFGATHKADPLAKGSVGRYYALCAFRCTFFALLCGLWRRAPGDSGHDCEKVAHYFLRFLDAGLGCAFGVKGAGGVESIRRSTSSGEGWRVLAALIFGWYPQ